MLDDEVGTPLLTPEGYKPIDQFGRGHLIQTQPDGDQVHEKCEDHDEPRWWERN
jgi:hypothetical protein